MSSSHRQPSRRTALKTAIAAGAAAVASKALAWPDTPAAPAGQPAGSAGSAGPGTAAGLRADADHFLGDYNREYLKLYTANQEAQWLAATDVSDAHTDAATASQNALDAFVGNKERMERIAALRDRTWAIDPVVSRQLDRAWIAAAHAPGTIADLVKQRAEAEAKQGATQNGFTYEIKTAGAAPRKVSANDIDDTLLKSKDLKERQAVWEASKELGVACRPGLIKLRDLRNRVARELKYSSLMGLELAADDLAVRELGDLMRNVLSEIRPLYEHLHCYAKHKLAQRYGQPVPRRIPAHWLPNRWGQEWRGIEEGANLDPLFTDKKPEWIIQQAERFYLSMGFPKLPEPFWKKSDLYELPADAPRKKNRHASAWHINLDHDVRSLMSVKADSWWFGTTHHELGHIYYYLSYTDAGVPLLLRDGANGAFHEAIGDLIALAARQRPYLSDVGLMKPGDGGDPARWLLADALDGSIVFLPFACGTMTGWEMEFYEKDMSPDRMNARWWEIVRLAQGIDPPTPRGEEFCDAASKTHINDTPAYYYKYAIGTLLKHQFHDYIARKILKQDPRACSYYNRKDVGEYLHALLSLGATRNWRSVLRDFTGEDLSARALMDYYSPLLDFLKKENAGRDVRFG